MKDLLITEKPHLHPTPTLLEQRKELLARKKRHAERPDKFRFADSDALALDRTRQVLKDRKLV